MISPRSLQRRLHGLLLIAGLTAALPAAALDEAQRQRWIDDLASEDITARTDAALALAQLGPEAEPAIPALIAIIDDQRPVVPATQAIKAVIPTSPGTLARKALVAVGEPAIPRLVLALTNDSERIRWRLTETLGFIGGERAVPPLVRGLEDDSRLVQIAAAEALAKIGDAVIEPLMERLQRRGQPLNVHQIWVLGEIHDPQSMAPLLQLYFDSPPEVSEQCGQALLKYGDDVVDPLVAILTGAANEEGKMKAATLLGQLGVDRAVNPLLESMLANPHPLVRVRAMQALAPLLKDQLVVPLLVLTGDGNRRVANEAKLLMTRMGKPAADAVVPYIKDPHPSIQNLAFISLVTMENSGALALMSLLRDRTLPPSRRASAAQALRINQMTPRFINDQILMNIFTDDFGTLFSYGLMTVHPLLDEVDYMAPSSAVRAMNVLALMRAPVAIPKLVSYLDNENDTLVRGSMTALYKVHDLALEQLINVAVYSRKPTAENAAELLQRAKYQPATVIDRIEYLIALQDWPELAKLGGAVPTYLLELVQTDEDPRRRARAAQALAEVHLIDPEITVDEEFLPPGAADALFADDPDAAQRGMQELAASDTRQAASLLLVPLLSSNYQQVQSAVTAWSAWSDQHADLLIGALEHHPDIEQNGPSRALIARGESVAPHLLALARDNPYPEVRAAAIKTLTLMNYSSRNPAQQAEYQILARRWNEVAQLGDAAVPGLVALVGQDDLALRRLAIDTLGHIVSDAAFPHLVAALTNPDPNTRILAVQHLGRHGARAIGPLASALETTDLVTSVVIGHQLKALGYDPTDNAKKFLFLVASEQWADLQAMGLVPRQHLLNYCRTGTAQQRLWASIALSRLQQTRVISEEQYFESLYAALGASTAETRAAAASRLGALGKEAGPAVDRLIELLGEETELTASTSPFKTPGVHAARALAQIGQVAIDSLLSALEGDDPVVRENARLALSLMPDPRLIDLHIELLKLEPTEYVSLNAAGSLGQVPNPRVVTPLLEAATSRDRFLARRAYRSLVNLGSVATDYLLPYLDNPSLLPKYRPVILRLLAETGNPLMLPHTLANTYPGRLRESDRLTAIRNLGNYTDRRAIDRLIELLGDRSRFARWAAGEALDGFQMIAVGPCIEALPRSSGKQHDHLVRVLELITHQGHGEDAQAWRNWWDSVPKRELPSRAAPLDTAPDGE